MSDIAATAIVPPPALSLDVRSAAVDGDARATLGMIVVINLAGGTILAELIGDDAIMEFEQRWKAAKRYGLHRVREANERLVRPDFGRKPKPTLAEAGEWVAGDES